jgi:hypothetical protein
MFWASSCLRESRRKNAPKQNKRKILGRTRLHGKWTHEWRKEKCIKESRSQPPTPYSNSSRFFSRISPRSLFILSIWRWPNPAKVAAKLRPHCCSCLLQANFSVIGVLAHSSRLPRARRLGRKDRGILCGWIKVGLGASVRFDWAVSVLGFCFSLVPEVDWKFKCNAMRSLLFRCLNLFAGGANGRMFCFVNTTVHLQYKTTDSSCYSHVGWYDLTLFPIDAWWNRVPKTQSLFLILLNANWVTVAATDNKVYYPNTISLSLSSKGSC